MPAPRVFGSNTIISQECVITLCLPKVFFSSVKRVILGQRKYTILSELNLTISFRFFSFSIFFFSPFQLSWKCKLATVKSFKADVSSIRSQFT